MRIATWNIYWLGDRSEEHIVRTEEDERLIAEVIRNVSPDVMALQEIVDPVVMERILEQANGPGTRYVIRSAVGEWLSSDSNPADEGNNLQKVFLCINTETVEFLRGVAIRGGPGGRRPYAAALRHRASGQEFVAVAVHLRSGFPAFLDEADAAVRKQEAAALARWLRGEAAAQNPSFPEPEASQVVVLGDFNAQLDDPNDSLDPLKGDALPGWALDNPRPDDGHWETALYEGDRLVIDFIMQSPAVAERVETPPTVYAWDYDPRLGGPTRFHYGADGSGRLMGYGVSDHRPIILNFDPHGTGGGEDE